MNHRPAPDRTPLHAAAAPQAPADASGEQAAAELRWRTVAAAPAGPGAPVATPASPTSVLRGSPPAAQDPVALTLQQLSTLLDHQPLARQVMRALALLEKGLARQGWRALDKMPLHAMERARDQLEGLVSNWAPSGLGALRSKLAVALIERDEVVMAVPCEDYRTTFLLDVPPAPPAPDWPPAPPLAPAALRRPAPLPQRRAQQAAVPPQPTSAPAPLSGAPGSLAADGPDHDMAALVAIYASLGGVWHPQPAQAAQLQATVAAAKARQLQARHDALAHWR